jgi:hypothetical protein
MSPATVFAGATARDGSGTARKRCLIAMRDSVKFRRQTDIELISANPTQRRRCRKNQEDLWENLERAKGIEPSYAAWEAAVLPLNYARASSEHKRRRRRRQAAAARGDRPGIRART